MAVVGVVTPATTMVMGLVTLPLPTVADPVVKPTVPLYVPGAALVVPTI